MQGAYGMVKGELNPIQHFKLQKEHGGSCLLHTVTVDVDTYFSPQRTSVERQGLIKSNQHVKRNASKTNIAYLKYIFTPLQPHPIFHPNHIWNCSRTFVEPVSTLSK